MGYPKGSLDWHRCQIRETLTSMNDCVHEFQSIMDGIFSSMEEVEGELKILEMNLVTAKMNASSYEKWMREARYHAESLHGKFPTCDQCNGGKSAAGCTCPEELPWVDDES